MKGTSLYTKTHASQQLSVRDGEVFNQYGDLFDRVAYSRFKYGYLPPAVEYGRALAREIEDDLFDLVGTEPIRIVSAPYKYLPTASHAVAEVLRRELAIAAINREVEPPVLVPFHKSRTGSSSYAKSTEADRLRSLATLGLRIDESLIRGAHVLVVDDIRITGSAERATAAYLEAFEPMGVWYLHTARFPEEVGKVYSHIEDELNQSSPHGPIDILADTERGHFRLNTRVLRHILEYETADFWKFLDGASDSLIQEMYDAALGSGLKYFRIHQARIALLSSELRQREMEQYATV